MPSNDEKEMYLILNDWHSSVSYRHWRPESKFKYGETYWRNPKYKNRFVSMEERWLTTDEAYDIAKFKS